MSEASSLPGLSGASARDDDVCKLTGEQGRYVKAHLIPAALTLAGRPLTQHGRGGRPVPRWTSWYDQQLVTAAGERILEAYDTWGISELRRQKLIWSSWGPMLELSVADYKRLPVTLDDMGWGLRRIRPTDPAKLRLFFLSLLWRAAESTRWEFDEVAIEEPHLSTLRGMVLNGDPTPLHLFPIALCQISTRGLPHNLAPMSTEIPFPRIEGREIVGETMVSSFRFYFDGLIVHFDRRTDVGPSPLKGNERSYLGCAEEVAFVTVPYQTSWERVNLERIMVDELIVIHKTMETARVPGYP